MSQREEKLKAIVTSEYPRKPIRKGFEKKFKVGDFPALDQVRDKIDANELAYQTGKIDRETWKKRQAPLTKRWDQLMKNAETPYSQQPIDKMWEAKTRKEKWEEKQ